MGRSRGAVLGGRMAPGKSTIRTARITRDATLSADISAPSTPNAADTSSPRPSTSSRLSTPLVQIDTLPRIRTRYLEPFVSHQHEDVISVDPNPEHAAFRWRDWSPVYSCAYSHAAKRETNEGPKYLALTSESVTVKYLHLSHDVQLLLQQHQVFVLDQFHQPASQLDLTKSFPQLHLLCITHPYQGEKSALGHAEGPQLRELAVEIFKPMTFDDMVYRCIPDDYNATTWAGEHCYTSSIDSLTIHQGGGFRPSTGAIQLCTPESVDVHVDRFTLNVRNKSSTEEIERTFDTILAFIGMSARSEFREERGLRPLYLDAKCSSAVLDVLSRSIKSTLKSFVRIIIDLSDTTTTGTELLRHLETLGEYYSALWTVDLEAVDESLLLIMARGDVAIPIVTQERTGCPPVLKGGLTGWLAPSRMVGDGENGFRAQYVAEGRFEGCLVAISDTSGAAWNPLANRAVE